MKTAISLMLPLALTIAADRITIPLDGEWEIGESVSSTERPARFLSRGPVPGLAHSARPPLPDVDEFESFELSNHRADRKSIPEEQRLRSGRGRTKQQRNYLWYRKVFRAPEAHESARIRIAKAQFGAAVWLNGTALGSYDGCFSASTYAATKAVRWGAENELLIRIGAHPGMLPESADCGQDGEKNRWTPGIYDRVSFIASGGVWIESVQVAPRIAESAALIQTRITNNTTQPATSQVRQRVFEAVSGKVAATAESPKLTLQPAESRLIDITVRIERPRLWSPEDPFLYRVETSTAGDSATSRFGMREFRFDPATRRALLNGKPYYLRGSNITLHRFFEDPQSGTLPWDEAWVRKLLVDIPRRLHWNSFRFCIGPVPDRWLEIADQAGLLIQNEYFYWTKRPTDSVHMHFDTAGLIRNFSDWMRDNWNHPSVVIWDANNETTEPVFHERVIPAVRGLDLSQRPWDNGWNPPAGPTDPIEDHLYEFNKFAREFPAVYDGMADLDRRGKDFAKKAAESGHARILNEYGWNWLNRDGTPTELTKSVYAKMPGILTPEERIEEQNYLLAGVTEFWRSTRIFAGILHFVYLTSSDPGAFTADHFRDIEKLELHTAFERYIGEAFKPLGVYVSYWKREHKPGERVAVPVRLTNDHPRLVRGRLSLEITGKGGAAGKTESRSFEVPALGTAENALPITLPPRPGAFTLTAVAALDDGTSTRSVRKIFLKE